MTSSQGTRLALGFKLALLALISVATLSTARAEFYGVNDGFCSYCAPRRVVRRPCYRPRPPCYRPRPVCRRGCFSMRVRYVVPVAPACPSCNYNNCCNNWAASYGPCRSCGVYYPPYSYRNYDPDIATGDDDVIADPDMNGQY